MPPREPLQKTFRQRCRPDQWTDTTQTLWSDSRHRWAGAIMVNGDERHMQHVPEGENFLNVGSSEYVNFLAIDTKIGTLTHLDRGITNLYKKFIWGAYCTCWARAQNLHLFYLVKAAGQTNGRTAFKLRGPMLTRGEQVPLW